MPVREIDAARVGWRQCRLVASANAMCVLDAAAAAVMMPASCWPAAAAALLTSIVLSLIRLGVQSLGSSSPHTSTAAPHNACEYRVMSNTRSAIQTTGNPTRTNNGHQLQVLPAGQLLPTEDAQGISAKQELLGGVLQLLTLTNLVTS